MRYTCDNEQAEATIVELQQKNKQLQKRLDEIAFICSYGWTDVTKEVSKIYDIAMRHLYE